MEEKEAQELAREIYEADIASAIAAAQKAALMSPEEMASLQAEVCKLMLTSSCFGREVCPFPPCACAQSLIDMVVAAERERCAQIAERYYTGQEPCAPIVETYSARIQDKIREG